jgi:hypothetical protein
MDFLSLALPMKLQQLAFTSKEVIKVAATEPHLLATAHPYVNQLRVNSILKDIESTPEGKELLEDMRKHQEQYQQKWGARKPDDPFIKLATTPGYKDGLYTYHNIFGPAFQERGVTTAAMLHELRHAQQDLKGVFDPKDKRIIPPNDALLFSRFYEADAQATAVDIAYKMKLAGKPAAWESLFDPKTPLFHNTAEAYLREVTRNPESLHTGAAKRAAFDGWFKTGESPHIEAYNQQAIRSMPSLVSMKYGIDQGIPTGRLTTADIQKLGEAPGKPNYLTLPGGRPFDSPYYNAPVTNPMHKAMIEHGNREYAQASAYHAQKPGSSMSRLLQQAQHGALPKAASAAMSQAPKMQVQAVQAPKMPAMKLK